MSKLVLETIVNSARDLPSVRLFGDMKVYVVVSLSTDTENTQKTLPDLKGETNPSWNFKMRFPFDVSTLPNVDLIFELKCERTFGDKEVGEVRVPIRNLLAKAVGNPLGSIQVVTYPVKAAKGGQGGSLTFSCSFARDGPAGGLPPNQLTQQPGRAQQDLYMRRLQELGLVIGTASLAGKLYELGVGHVAGTVSGTSGAEDISSGLGIEPDVLNVDLPSVDLSEAVNPDAVEASFSFLDAIVSLLTS